MQRIWKFIIFLTTINIGHTESWVDPPSINVLYKSLEIPCTNKDSIKNWKSTTVTSDNNYHICDSNPKIANKGTLSFTIFDENDINIRCLSLRHNKIQELEDTVFQLVPNLEYLTLSNNSLKSLPPHVFVNLKYLKHLDLSKNKLKNLPIQIFKNLAFLEVLNLGENRVKNLGSGSEVLFSNQHNLKFLNLSSNCLKELSKDQFAQLGDLRALNIANNQLRTIGDLLESLKVLEMLSLDDNPFTCDSEFQKIVMWCAKINITLNNTCEDVEKEIYLCDLETSKNCSESNKNHDENTQIHKEHSNSNKYNNKCKHRSTRKQEHDEGSDSIESKEDTDDTNTNREFNNRNGPRENVEDYSKTVMFVAIGVLVLLVILLMYGMCYWRRKSKSLNKTHEKRPNNSGLQKEQVYDYIESITRNTPAAMSGENNQESINYEYPQLTTDIPKINHSQDDYCYTEVDIKPSETGEYSSVVYAQANSSEMPDTSESDSKNLKCYKTNDESSSNEFLRSPPKGNTSQQPEIIVTNSLYG